MSIKSVVAGVVMAGAVLLLFRHAFGITYMMDDFFFLKIGHAATPQEFIHFFSPFKNYFYRPLPTELFYYLLNTVHQHIGIAHLLIFAVYGCGLLYLFKTIYHLSQSTFFAYLLTLLYGIHTTHVFQLYQIATDIEVFLFTFLILSAYYALKQKWGLSILFFICALCSKETAILFPIAAGAYAIGIKKKQPIPWYYLVAISLIAVVFFFIYKPGTSSVMTIDTYQLHWQIKLMVNNFIWYLLWSLGLPNFVPNYMKSIFFQPLPEFWNLFHSADIRLYFDILILYAALFLPTAFLVGRKEKHGIPFLISCCFGFTLFIAPTIPTIHRWEVRLTVPLLFIVAIQAYIIWKAYLWGGIHRLAAVALLLLCISLSIIGIPLQESSSLLVSNSLMVKKADAYFTARKERLRSFSAIYFVDAVPNGSSKELKNLFGDNNYADNFFKDHPIPMYYGADGVSIPPNSYVIDASNFRFE